MSVYVHEIESPIGPIRLVAGEEALTECQFGAGPLSPVPEGAVVDPTRPVLREAARQLAAYFAGRLRAFDLPLAAPGTDFQRTVWRALLEIPFGETRSYADIARAVGRPTAVRAVGGANGRNPIGIIVPCHRVIGKDGTLTGYAGGLDAKRALLALERDALGLFSLSR